VSGVPRDDDDDDDDDADFCSWKSSLRSSARQRLSSLQRAAGRRLQRLHKAVSFERSEHDPRAGETANVSELSR